MSPEPWLPRLVCPECRTPVGPVGATTTGECYCASCGTTFEQRGNLWRFLTTRPRAGGRGVRRAVSRRSRARRPSIAPPPELLPDAAVGASRSPAGSRVADPARELCASAGARDSGHLARPDARPRARRRLRLAVVPARDARLSRRGRRSPRRRGRRAGRVPALSGGVPGGAGRLRRAAVRAASVRRRRVQRIAALLERSGGEPARSGAHGLAGRSGGGDGLADVPARGRRRGDGRRPAAPDARPSTASRSRSAPASGSSRTRGMERAFRSLGPSGPVLPVARPAGLAAAPPDRPLASRPSAGRVRRVGRPNDRPLQSRCSTTPGKQPLPLSRAVAGRGARGTVSVGARRRQRRRDDPAADIAALLSAGSVAARRRAARRHRHARTAADARRSRSAATVRARLPHVPIVWGGYFPTQHADTVLGSPFVDFVIRSQGEQPLLGSDRGDSSN